MTLTSMERKAQMRKEKTQYSGYTDTLDEMSNKLMILYCEGKTYKCIATTLGITQNEVKRLKRRAESVLHSTRVKSNLKEKMRMEQAVAEKATTATSVYFTVDRVKNNASTQHSALVKRTTPNQIIQQAHLEQPSKRTSEMEKLTKAYEESGANVTFAGFVKLYWMAEIMGKKPETTVIKAVEYMEKSKSVYRVSQMYSAINKA